MAMAADFLLSSMREIWAPMTQEERSESFEILINAMARLGVEYLPAAEVAKLLRQYAETLEE